MGMRGVRSDGRRVGELLGGPFAWARGGRGRVTKVVAVALAAVLAAGLLVAGVGAWLSRSHAAGGTRGQDGDVQAAGAQVIAGHGVAYVVFPKAGTVQQVDPASLADLGPSVTLTAPLAVAALDGSGTLWVPVPALGELVPVHRGKPGMSVVVGAPHEYLQLTIAGGTPVVTDSASATVTVVGTAGVVRSVSLRSSLGQSAELVTPATTGGPTVPVLSRSSHRVLVVDTASGAASSPASLKATGGLGAPQLLGDLVYVPDQSTGELIVYDTRLGKLDGRIRVTGRHGQLEAFLDGGQLLVDDQDSGAAVIVGSDGAVRALDVAASGAGPVPSPTPRPAPSPSQRPKRP